MRSPIDSREFCLSMFARGIYFLLSAIMAAFAVSGVFMLNYSHYFVSGLIGILLGSFGAIRFMRETLRTTARLILSEEGIDDKSIGLGVIPWSEILRATPYYPSIAVYVGLDLKDFAKWENQLWVGSRWLAKANYVLGWGHVSVNLTGLPYKQALAIIRNHLPLGTHP